MYVVLLYTTVRGKVNWGTRTTGHRNVTKECRGLAEVGRAGVEGRVLGVGNEDSVLATDPR
jgi:hypothetical protein